MQENRYIENRLPDPNHLSCIYPVCVPDLWIERKQVVERRAKTPGDDLECISILDGVNRSGGGHVDHLSDKDQVRIPKLGIDRDEIVNINIHSICDLAQCITPLDHISPCGYDWCRLW